MRPQRLRDALIVSALITASNGALAAPLMLNPLANGPFVAGGGLTAEWVQIRNDYQFSEYQWHEPGESAPRDISSFGWGTGIWATGDLAHVRGLGGDDPAVVARSNGMSGVNFANDEYNAGVTNGSFSDADAPWPHDYLRPVAPVVNVLGQQTNYAAFLNGFLYVPIAGLYDFGVFADDGFVFSLFGADGQSLGMEYETLAGSVKGRDFFTYSGANGNQHVRLQTGYYGIGIEYFNRLEAGVFELSWWFPDDNQRTGISTDYLFASIPALSVPEPGTLALLGLAGMGLWGGRQRRSLTAG